MQLKVSDQCSIISRTHCVHFGHLQSKNTFTASQTETRPPENLGAAVCIMAGEGVTGLVRFVQTSHDTIVIDGAFDGLSQGLIYDYIITNSQ